MRHVRRVPDIRLPGSRLPSKRSMLAFALVSALLGSGCAPAGPPIATSTPAAPTSAPKPTLAATAPATQNRVPVKVGLLRQASDSGVFIALEKGYFAEQGLDVEIVDFGAGSDIATQMATEHVQVGGSAPNAAILNAVARGVGIKIVADKGSNPKGFGHTALVVRKDLLDNKSYSTPKDLKGKKVAIPDPVSAGMIELEGILRVGGLSAADVEIVRMPFPDQIPAFAGKAIDAALSVEPFVTIMSGQGIAARAMGVDEAMEGHQVSALMYAPEFSKSEAAKRFMFAYVKGVRDYNDAFQKRQNLDEVVQITAKHSTTKDPELLKRMVPAGLNPDGYANSKSLEGDLAWYARGGHVTAPLDISKLVDDSYADFAVQQLGRYAR